LNRTPADHRLGVTPGPYDRCPVSACSPLQPVLKARFTDVLDIPAVPGEGPRRVASLVEVIIDL
jgi:hypothetical protein